MPPKSELKELYSKRTIILNKVDRFGVYLDDHDAENGSITQLKLRTAKFEECWNEFGLLQDNIELIASPDESQKEQLVRQEFENKYFTCLDRAQSKMSTQETSSNSIKDKNSLEELGVKLQPISLPKFDGKIEEWLSFSDMYKSAVHNNNNIPPIRKFYCLRSCLSGTAANVIKNIETTEANYEGAWELIEKRFSNKKLIVYKHVNSLFELPRLNKENPLDLRALLDNTQKHLQALKALGEPIETWDTLLVYLTSSKFDNTTLRAWQESNQHETTMELLTEFLSQRCRVLESLPKTYNAIASNSKDQNRVTNSSFQPNQNKFKPSKSPTNNACLHTQLQTKCKICAEPHAIYNCAKFLNLSIENRIKKINDLKLCSNCLKSNNHTLEECKSGSCKFCAKRHNTYLHLETPINEPNSKNQPIVSAASSGSANVILSTAVITIINANGEAVPCRVLLDSGSQSNFLTESICSFLGLKHTYSDVPVSGINGISTQVAHKTTAIVKSNYSDLNCSTNFLVIPQITSNIPCQQINHQLWKFPDVPLADPTWNSPSKVDGLLGAQIFWDLLLDRRIKIENHPITLRETKLGWIVCGTIKSSQSSSHYPSQSSSQMCHLASLNEVDEHIQAFWKLEEITSTSVTHTGEDKLCERHFENTVHRTDDGRYIVQLPLRQDPSVLGDSKQSALQRFLKLESKLIQHPQLHDDYKKFMNEYLCLNHMTESDSSPSTFEYFIPHHCIRKESSSTTKLRVVFDASAKTSSGISLNDILMVGPTIQNSLFSILLRFRTYNYIMTADVEKMYRQILLDPSQTALQKIFWRENPNDKIKIYELKTITYGTASAPYLATRALKQLFEDEGSQFPHATTAGNDFYMDDLLTGFNTVTEGLKKQAELIEMLQRGKLHLRKWCATHDDLLKHITEDDQEPLQTFTFQGETASAIKTLGLIFDPRRDSFRFSVKNSSHSGLTKRKIISDIALIFDPLGVIGPVIVMAKIFMQELWRRGLGWDEQLPDQLQEQWINFSQTFKILETITIPRQATVDPINTISELHAFSDASETAYGTCIYIRSVDKNTGSALGSHLLCSKSRVAPLKAMSLPRLELAAALLMAQLTNDVGQSLGINKNKIFYWTDSTVVLSWINSPSTNWVTFVANRVSKIQDLSLLDNWQHISGSINPADVISRGCHADILASSCIWWNGPPFLYEQHGLAQLWSKAKYTESSEIPDKKNDKVTLLMTESSNFKLLHRFSSIKKLNRIMAYVKRFIHNSKINKQAIHLRQVGQLTISELKDSMDMILRLTQEEVYSEEIKLLLKQKPLPKSSKLITLYPFLCEKHLLRVGGRIIHADIPQEQKNPVILPPNHHITKLIARDKHEELLHCGAQTLLATIRLQYWPINGRHLMNSIIKGCIRCFRVKPTFSAQLMGNLPHSRVNQSRPFTHTGLDYLGPINVKLNNARKSTPIKTHVALFICMATKALHLELVEDQSTAAFLSALRRFISRRGAPSAIYSDNASTFKGAANQLQHQGELIDFGNNCGIEWHFNPPYTPHMGGLWEASVKRVKFHLRRIMGPHILTFVNLYTLLTEIEAIINSRPLFPLSNDPTDFSYLTPAHFLVGTSLTALPEPTLTHLPYNRLNQWQLVQRMTQSFWSIWQRFYLSELQQRTKWKMEQSNLVEGTLVLIRDDKTRPMIWTVGRVSDLHAGSDLKVRVVSVKTPAGIQRCSVNRICPLPISEDEAIQF